MKISPARIAAYEVLLRVERDQGFSSILLPQFEADLVEKDRTLCHEIVLGVLRRKYLLDRSIAAFAGSKKIDLEVLISLRIGAYQLIFLDRVPDHSAVNESVALVERARKASAKGFVNAILRKIADSGGPPEIPGGSGRISVETSHPLWLLDHWGEQFGEERAAAIAEANNRPPRLAFRRTKKGVESGIALPANAQSSTITEGAFTVDRLSANLRSMADRGEIYFQDEASQLVANTVQVPIEGRFLDVCAAPGGKTTQIAAHSNAMIVAGDLYGSRVEFLRANAVRQGVPEINVVRYNAEISMPFAVESFDTILLDAPCSGTGTIRSNPEIRYSLSPGDFKELSSKQLTILGHASKLLRKGGVLYYSTCSLEAEENEGVINEFLQSTAEFQPATLNADERFRTADGFLRTYPDRDGTDGFFLACLRRG